MSDYQFSYDDLDSMINDAAFDYNSVNDIDLSGIDFSGINGLDLPSNFDINNINGLDLPGGFNIDETAFDLDNIDAMLADAAGGTGGFNLGNIANIGDIDLGNTNVGDAITVGDDIGDIDLGNTNIDDAESNTSYGDQGNAYGEDDTSYGDQGPGGYSDTDEEVQSWQNLEDSGTNTESMDGYTYDKKTGTWTTPSGDVYTPDNGTDDDTDDDIKKDDEGATCAPGFHDDGTGFCVPDDDEEEDTDDDADDDDTKKDDTKKDDTKKDDTKKDGTKTTKDGLGSLLPLLLALLAMNRGSGGGGGQSAVIPGLTATQRQTPYTQQQRAPGYRPGQGGISYFDQTQYAPKMASGGIARLLKGPGDGVSDSIPAVITNGMSRGGQPAKVARGEYIIDARTVAALGNGSTDAGAERLDKMRRNILRDDRKAGVGKDSKAYRHLMA